jgi:hypothetical protein
VPRITVRGRQSSDERCAICHGPTTDKVRRCSGCGVTTHGDCLSAHARCPTLGCAVPVSGARVVDVSPLPREGPPSARGQAELIAGMKKPLTISCIIAIAGLATSTWPLVSWSWFERMVVSGFEGAGRSDRPLIIAAGLFVFAFVVVAPTLIAIWFAMYQRDLIRRVPAILARGPRTMSVTLSSKKDDEGDDVWRADFDAKGLTMSISFGIERPEWLASEATVRVYNWGESPVFIETADGTFHEKFAAWHYDGAHEQ